MLMRTRALISLAQPKTPEYPEEEQEMFRRFVDHLQDSIRILLQHTQHLVRHAVVGVAVVDENSQLFY